MKRIMGHFIWGFTVCKSTSIRVFPYTKGYLYSPVVCGSKFWADVLLIGQWSDVVAFPGHTHLLFLYFFALFVIDIKMQDLHS